MTPLDISMFQTQFKLSDARPDDGVSQLILRPDPAQMQAGMWENNR